MEAIFAEVRSRLAGRVIPRVVVCPFFSNGLLRRVANCIYAWFHQSTINHVTGDVHYLGLLLSRGRTIHTIHDVLGLETHKGLRRAVFKLFWVAIPIARAKLVTVVSDATRRDILRHVRCDPAKVVVIPNPMLDRYVRKDKLFNKEAPIVLQIGTAKNKNVPRLIEALQGTKCRLRIVGMPVPAHARLARELGVPLEVYSVLSSEAMLRRYEESDIVVLASTHEGFGMPIIEAQAIGRPVITSNISAMPEVAGAGACLVDPSDVKSIREGLLRVIDDDEYRAHIVEAGFNNVKRFDAGSIAEQYFEAYTKVHRSLGFMHANGSGAQR